MGEVAGGRAGEAAFLLFLASWSGDGLVLREDPPRSQLPLQEGREIIPGGNEDQHRGGVSPHHSAQRAITRGFSLMRSRSALTWAPFSPGSVLTQSTHPSRSRLVSSGAEDPPTEEAKLVSPSKSGAAYELGGPATHHAGRCFPGCQTFVQNPRRLGKRGHPVSLRTSGALGVSTGLWARPLPSRAPTSLQSARFHHDLCAVGPRDPQSRTLYLSPSDSSLSCQEILHHAGLGLLTKSQKATTGLRISLNT